MIFNLTPTAVVLVRMIVAIHMTVATLLQGDAQRVGAGPLVVQAVVLDLRAPLNTAQKRFANEIFRTSFAYIKKKKRKKQTKRSHVSDAR